MSVCNAEMHVDRSQIHKEIERKRVGLSYLILTTLNLCVCAFWWENVVQIKKKSTMSHSVHKFRKLS